MIGMWTALLTGPSHLTQAKRIAFRCYCFCFELYVNSQTTYFFAWLYLYFGSGYQPKLVSEKNSIFSLTQFLHYAVFNVRALFLSLRCRFEPLRFAELFYSTSSPFVCQALFSSFFDVRFGGEGCPFRFRSLWQLIQITRLFRDCQVLFSFSFQQFLIWDCWLRLPSILIENSLLHFSFL